MITVKPKAPTQNVSKSRSFFVNTSSLFVLQIVSYALPFLLIPYLTRVLGATLYGVVAFGLSMAQIACIITDYGFNLSATYKIAKNQDDNKFINKILSAVFVCKTALFIIVACFIVLFLTIQTKYHEYNQFLWLMLLSVLGQTFQPIWFFQGIERMLFITLYTVISRIIFLFLVVFLVKFPTDYNYVALGNGIAHIIAAFIGIAMIYQLGFRFSWPGTSFIRKTFKESTEFFWSRAAVATYTSCGTFFLGLVSTPVQVAYYSAAEQLYKGGQAMFQPISQALYPHMAKHKNFHLFFQVLKWTVVINIICILIGITIGTFILNLLFGSDFVNSYPVLIIFLIIFGITTPSILLGYPYLGALGYSKLANRSVIYGGILQIGLLGICYFLGFKEAIQIVYTVLLVEFFVLTLRVVWSIKSFPQKYSVNG
jgi:polysaccharide transporter, PST family